MWETLKISGLCYKCMTIFNINTLSTCVQNTFVFMGKLIIMNHEQRVLCSPM